MHTHTKVHVGQPICCSLMTFLRWHVWPWPLTLSLRPVTRWP